ncbi:MAG: hypothetical protein H2054_08180 [Sphingomonas sp.]|uniref:hypothetical protein n=1 Tax=Sphingomonas sp. TaxID=28214 RepID=UPI000DB18965|nr:hypothetical protein [Sphingomonas sp.]PZP18738.1 MAG: hypothetical protein DI607_04285 [Sphingomonas hengshuiensis]
MRSFLLIATLTPLAACGSPQPKATTLTKVEAGQGRAADDAGQILCAPQGATSFERVCTLDRVVTPAGLMLTVSKPDGGFHRLAVTRDGRGVIAADGAEAALVSVVDNATIEVAIGGDRYRLPATVKLPR